MANNARAARPLARLWAEWKTLLIFLLVMFVFRSAFADWYQVPTPSMNPTIAPGDRVVVNKLAYDLKFPFTTRHMARWGEPHAMPGEIVTFYSPLDERRLIKRAIRVPGDRVAMRNNQLLINDKSLAYENVVNPTFPHLSPQTHQRHDFYVEQIGDVRHLVMILASPTQPPSPTQSPPRTGTTFGPIEVPADHFLVLGDNRDNSADSRMIGFIARGRITGRAFSVNYDD